MFTEHFNGKVSTLECGHVSSSEQPDSINELKVRETKESYNNKIEKLNLNNDLPSGKRKEILLQILESFLPKLTS